jgi:hypothetical protein
MALAYATDLAEGHFRDFALRSCVLAMRFAKFAGLDESMERKVFHQALLRYLVATQTRTCSPQHGVTKSPCAESFTISTWATGKSLSAYSSGPSRESSLMPLQANSRKRSSAVSQRAAGEHSYFVWTL